MNEHHNQLMRESDIREVLGDKAVNRMLPVDRIMARVNLTALMYAAQDGRLDDLRDEDFHVEDLRDEDFHVDCPF